MLTLLFACLSSDPGAPAIDASTPTAEKLASARFTVPGLAPWKPRATANLSASATSGTFPLDVTFTADDAGSGAGYSWDFGDGDTATGLSVTHTYLGAGTFDATLAVTGLRGSASDAASIEVTEPGCPSPSTPVTWGTVDDSDLDEISGIVPASVADTYWIQEDSGNTPILVAIDGAGTTLSRHPLTNSMTDWEDLAAATDPDTGLRTLFFADMGDNAVSRSSISIWTIAEPDPDTDGDITPTRMKLTYPDGAHNAETLLVDPLTFDVYIVTKVSSGAASVYVKRAPHSGDATLEALGSKTALTMTATGGDVSPDGTRIVVRDYTATARVFIRDGYGPLEDAFDESACSVAIHSEKQGEAITFAEGGLVSVSEGAGSPIYFTGL